MLISLNIWVLSGSTAFLDLLWSVVHQPMPKPWPETQFRQYPAKLCACFFPFLGWKIMIFWLSGVLWNFDFFRAFLGVRTGPTCFPDVLASFLAKNMLKMVDWGSCYALGCSEFGFLKIYRLFGPVVAWYPEPLCSGGVFVNPKSRSLNAKFPGELFFPINLSDFQTKFSVFLAKSRNPAQKRKFLFSGRVKFCR